MSESEDNLAHHWDISRTIMNIYAIRMKLQPCLLAIGKVARRISFLSIFVVAIVLSPLIVQAQKAEPALTVTGQELEDLATLLEDETAREQLLSQIRALIATINYPEENILVKSASTRLIAALSDNVRDASQSLVAAADAVRDIPALLSLFMEQAAIPNVRQFWLVLLFKVTSILFAGAVVEWLARLLLRRPRQALEEQNADTLWVRLPLLVGRTFLDLVPDR